MEEIDLKELFDYFKSKIVWVIVIIFAVLFIGNVYTLLTRVPLYKTNASLVLVSENNNTNAVYNNSEQQLNKNLVATYSEIIKSKAVLNDVISNLKLKMTYVELKREITVEAVENTEIINIYVVDKKAKKASIIANEISNVFVSKINSYYKLNNVTILDKAEIVKKPYNSNYLKDNVIYLLVGVVLSCGVIFLFFYFDTTIKTSDEIENKLNLTVIGTVPKIGKE